MGQRARGASVSLSLSTSTRKARDTTTSTAKARGHERQAHPLCVRGRPRPPPRGLDAGRARSQVEALRGRLGGENRERHGLAGPGESGRRDKRDRQRRDREGSAERRFGLDRDLPQDSRVQEHDDLCDRLESCPANGPFTVDAKQKLPPFTLPGTYQLKVTAKDESGKEVVCMILDLQIKGPAIF